MLMMNNMFIYERKIGRITVTMLYYKGIITASGIEYVAHSATIHRLQIMELNTKSNEAKMLTKYKIIMKVKEDLKRFYSNNRYSEEEINKAYTYMKGKLIQVNGV